MAVSAYILIQTEVGKAAQVAEEVGEIDGVVSAEDVTGPYDVIARAEADTVDELGQDGRQPGADDRRASPARSPAPSSTSERGASGRADDHGPDAEAHEEQPAQPVEQVRWAASCCR